MKREVITKGTEISTEEGYLIITGYNGHIVYADHHKQTWPDDAEEFTDDNAIEVTEKERLTLSEIGLMMKAVDGLNHRVVYEAPEEEKNPIRSLRIREISGMTRAEFAREYNIPIRTLEEWDAERRKAPDWVLDLLERVVREDFG